MEAIAKKPSNLIGSKAFEYHMIQFLTLFCKEKGLEVQKPTLTEGPSRYDISIVDERTKKMAVVEIKMYGRNGIGLEPLKSILDKLYEARKQTGSTKMILISNTPASQINANLKTLETVLDHNKQKDYHDLEVIGSETFRGLHLYYSLNFESGNKPPYAKVLLSLMHHLVQASSLVESENTFRDKLDPNTNNKK